MEDIEERGEAAQSDLTLRCSLASEAISLSAGLLSSHRLAATLSTDRSRNWVETEAEVRIHETLIPREDKRRKLTNGPVLRPAILLPAKVRPGVCLVDTESDSVAPGVEEGEELAVNLRCADRSGVVEVVCRLAEAVERPIAVVEGWGDGVRAGTGDTDGPAAAPLSSSKDLISASSKLPSCASSSSSLVGPVSSMASSRSKSGVTSLPSMLLLLNLPAMMADAEGVLRRKVEEEAGVGVARYALALSSDDDDAEPASCVGVGVGRLVGPRGAAEGAGVVAEDDGKAYEERAPDDDEDEAAGLHAGECSLKSDSDVGNAEALGLLNEGKERGGEGGSTAAADVVS